jgi:hypothetical protein
VQEGVTEIGATVLRENLVRLDGLPLVTRVSSLPALDPDTVVRLAVEEVDLIDCKLLCRLDFDADPARRRSLQGTATTPPVKMPKIAAVQELEGILQGSFALHVRHPIQYWETLDGPSRLLAACIGHRSSCTR